mgnify:CR=1 FL=1
MIIRELEKKDVSEIESIYDLYWSGNFRKNLSKRLQQYVEHSSETIEQDFHYFIAEENNEVVGVSAFRKVLGHMIGYTSTNKPAEFYISAVKYKGKGIGTALRSKRIEEAKKLGKKIIEQ